MIKEHTYRSQHNISLHFSPNKYLQPRKFTPNWKLMTPKPDPPWSSKSRWKLTYDKAEKTITLAEKLYNEPSTESKPAYESLPRNTYEELQGRTQKQPEYPGRHSNKAHDFSQSMASLATTSSMWMFVRTHSLKLESNRRPLAHTNEVLRKMVANNLSFGVDLICA